MSDTKMTNFATFLHQVEQQSFETNVTAKGVTTIKQTPRNELKRAGVEAFKQDLIDAYGDEFDVVETADGIVIVAENEPNNFTLSWEIKMAIKSLDYDPFMAANNYEDSLAAKANKKASQEAEKLAKEQRLSAKRAAKLAEVEAKQKFYNRK